MNSKVLHAPLNGDPSVETSWLLAARICLLSLALLSASLVTFFSPPSAVNVVELIYAPLILLYLFCIASALWMRSHKVGHLFVYAQLATDVTIVSGVVYVTGGLLSPFLFMYLPLVMISVILRSRRTGFGVAALASLEYGLLMFALLSGAILPADGTEVIVPTSGPVLQIIGLSSAMVLIAVATSYLKRTITRGFELVEQSKRDFSALSNRQQVIIEGMPNGVIVTDLDHVVLNINAAAQELLQVEQEESAGKQLLELLQEAGYDKSHLPEPQQGGTEITLHVEGEEDTVVVFQQHPVCDVNGNQNGSILIFEDITKLRSIEEELALQERMARMLSESSKESGPTYTKLENFVGESPVMQKVFHLIERVAESDATILVHGESGTGKELVARAIHLGSERAEAPFVPVNCGAIPENLIESELFGHKKGAFTGAESDHIGLFRQANSGTIFLDEIGELPLQMQAKLLRSIQEKTVRPVGADFDVPVDVRIITATNRDLKREAEAGSFREDLFYRLNVIGIQLPPLRNRKEDIPLLVNSILRKLAKQESTPLITPAAMKLLLDYDYPGNVRELENILERAIVLGGEAVLPEHLPENIHQVSSRLSSQRSPMKETQIFIDEELEFPIKLDDLLAKIEQRYLEEALNQTRGAKKKAAGLLGMNFRSFRYRLQKYGIGEE